MVMDKDGKVLTDSLYLNDYERFVDATADYIVTYDGIYSMTGEKVYDLTDKYEDVDVLDYERSIMLIETVAADGYNKVELFNNGTITEIGKIDQTGEYANTIGDHLMGVYTTRYGGYYTETWTNYAGTTYKYYSADGSLLYTSANGQTLEYVMAYENVYLYRVWTSTYTGSQYNYYKFS